jgi:hypothetical protein
MNMSTASKSGTRNPSRRNWRNGDRPRSRSGSRARPHPLTELASAVRALIRFHQTQADWFPPVSSGANTFPLPTFPPELKEAIYQAYQAVPAGPGDPMTGSQNLTAVKNATPR